MTINECYEILGKCVFNSIEEPWEKAVLNIQKLDHSVSFNGEYHDTSGNEKDIEVQIDIAAIKATKELHKITTEGKEDKWNRAKFHVTSSGKFNMEFIWDDDLNEEIKRLNQES